MTTITISARTHSLILTKSFAAKAAIFGSDEYKMLQEARHIYNEKKLISECHSKGFRYPVINSWFLDRFPEIKVFDVPITEEEADAPKPAMAS